MPNIPHDLRQPLVPVSYAFRCDTCQYQFRLRHPDEDPTTSGGGCRVCGSPDWHIYAKFSDGSVEILL